MFLAFIDQVSVHELSDAQRLRKSRRMLRRAEDAGSDTQPSVEIEVITADDPARRIAGEGERFDADVICIGSRGRYFIAKLFFGSISQEVLLRSDRPVLLVQTMQRDTERAGER